MKFAYDVTCIRPGAVGGVENAVHYMLDGFRSIDDDYEMDLLVTKQNIESFKEYEKDARIHLVCCYDDSSSIFSRLRWMIFGINQYLRTSNTRVFFSDQDFCPLNRQHGRVIVTTIHDMMIRHFPDSESFAVKAWQRFAWINAIRVSDKVVTISDYCKEDLIKCYPKYKDKFCRIYDAVAYLQEKGAETDQAEENSILEKFGVNSREYYYSISRMYPHKNYMTLLKVVKSLKEHHAAVHKLLITTGKVGEYEKFMDGVREGGLDEDIRITGFVSEKEKEVLIKNCKAFLFPSVFEGFGLGPIEAMANGATVVTTKESCIPEVTQWRANYVDNPFDEADWEKTILASKWNGPVEMERYSPDRIAHEILNLLTRLEKETAR